jgi:hypothetical protein
LFSALAAATGAVLLLALGFAVARFFQPTSVAIRIAVVFVVGASIGGVATGVSLALFVPSILVAAWQVIAYVASLAIGALLGGAILLVFFIKYQARSGNTRIKP